MDAERPRSAAASRAPARNRVTPSGLIVASPGRGDWMGNRGRLHDGAGSREIVRNHQTTAWITCRLQYRGWRAAQWHPRHYTPLFFLDEAVALAAGHRPCALCRHADYRTFRDAWALTHGRATVRAADIDAELHHQRHPGRNLPRVTVEDAWSGLPDGTFVVVDGCPAVVSGDRLVTYDERTNAYSRALPRPVRGSAEVLTPASTIDVLRAGYPVRIATGTVHVADLDEPPGELPSDSRL